MQLRAYVISKEPDKPVQPQSSQGIQCTLAVLMATEECFNGRKIL